MDNSFVHSYTSFEGNRRIATGSMPEVALFIKRTLENGAGTNPILIFDDTTGRQIDIDTRGSDDEVIARMKGAAEIGDGVPVAHSEQSASVEPRGRGRPKLGVIPREVTLLPRHWEWLATQPGGASVALRKLVEDARRAGGDKEKTRVAQERAYHFMSAMAGDMPGFEEATRALFAKDDLKFRDLVGAWPVDVRDYAVKLSGEIIRPAFTADA